MEVAGLVIGVAGLAGIFSVCVDCFGLVQNGRSLHRDHTILATRLSNQRLRFHAWGKACGLDSSNGYESRLDDPMIKQSIVATMQCIVLLFIDGEKLARRYKRSTTRKPAERPWNDEDGDNNNVLVLTRGPDAQIFRESSHSFLARLSHGGLFSSVRWALGDKKDFTELIGHLDGLIGDLERATAPLPGVAERQRHHIEWEIESIGDIGVLEAMADARIGDSDAVSDTATRRLASIHDGSSKIGPRTTLTGTVSTHRTFHTAPTQGQPAPTIEEAAHEGSDSPTASADQSVSLPQNVRLMKDLLATAEDAALGSGAENFIMGLSGIEGGGRGGYGSALDPVRRKIADRLRHHLPEPTDIGLFPGPNRRWGLRRNTLTTGWAPESIAEVPLDRASRQLVVFFEGPPLTPYAKGIFAVHFTATPEYPYSPPDVKLLTRIYHPNIDAGGKICLDLLEHPGWSPAMWQVDKIMMAIVSLLLYPGPDDPLVPEIAQTYLRNRAHFNENAKLYTEKYATLDAALAFIPPMMVEASDDNEGPGQTQLVQLQTQLAQPSILPDGTQIGPGDPDFPDPAETLQRLSHLARTTDTVPN